jgi:hypothetical protein
MHGGWARHVVLGAIVVALVLAGRLARRSRPPASPEMAPRTLPPAASREARGARGRPATKPDALAPPPALDPLEAAEGAWDRVDMEAVRAAMPDNLYWKLSAPTHDPALLAWREEERERWNTEYGKVLSNTATAEEVDAYYAFRRRLSLDYVEFATHLLANYGDVLPLRDRSLLALAVQMHLARLEEIPRQLAEAQERRAAQEALRKAWREEQQSFGGDAAAGQ